MKKICFLGLVWLIALQAWAAKKDFISSAWHLPPGAGMEHFKGQESLYIPKGVALLATEQLQDGIIEVDVSDDDARGFAGLVFHHDGKDTFEEVYLRLHKPKQPDALQYAPVYGQELSWALYAEHQAPVAFEAAAWTHLKIVVQQNAATVYVNYATTPALTISHLKLKHQTSGRIGVKALNGAYFSNFTFTPLPSTPVISEEKLSAPANTILRWQLSQALELSPTPTAFVVLPKQKDLTWETVTTEASGLLNIAALRVKQSESASSSAPERIVWVKLELESYGPQLRQFFFDYSNKTQVFLNGQPLYFGDNSFHAKGPTFRGDVDKTLQTTALFLPLKSGKNTLLMAVSSKANGWGVLGRLDSMAGISML